MTKETLNEILVYINDQISEHNIVKEALDDKLDSYFTPGVIHIIDTAASEQIKELQTAHTKTTIEIEILLKWKNSLPTEDTTIKQAKYSKEHNNYDFILGDVYPAIEYNDEWIMIDDQLYRRECFELLKTESEKK